MILKTDIDMRILQANRQGYENGVKEGRAMERWRVGEIFDKHGNCDPHKLCPYGDGTDDYCYNVMVQEIFDDEEAER